MRRRLSLLMAFAGVIGLLGLNPAQATHDGAANGKKDNGKHEGMPTPPDVNNTILAECTVRGTVSIGNSQSQGSLTGGVSETEKNHNHYRFRDTEITCDENLASDPDFAGTYSVDAAGGTDGPTRPDPLAGSGDQPHGEDAANGWSHSDCYTGTCTSWWGNKKMSFNDLYDGTNTNGIQATQCTNCGEILVTNTTTGLASLSPLNWVKFTRVGNQVIAWGVLVRTDGNTPPGGQIACFITHLNFTPGLGNSTLVKPKVDSAALDGTATVWDAKNNKVNCRGGKGQKR